MSSELGHKNYGITNITNLYKCTNIFSCLVNLYIGNSMKNIETQQLTETALKASFTEVQQRHFDKLMSELNVISGGLGFAELKEKAEAGNKEALQVLRDYIAKKEQIVEFIEKKEYGFMGMKYADIPVRNEELKINDNIAVVFATDGARKGQYIGSTERVLSVPGKEDEKEIVHSVVLKNGKMLTKTDEDVARIIENREGLLDLNKYDGVYAGQKLEYLEAEPKKSDMPANLDIYDIEAIKVSGFTFSFGRINIMIEFDLGHGMTRTMLYSTSKSLKDIYKI